MEQKQDTQIEKLVAQLQSEGWKMQRDGMVYINSTLATSLSKDGEVLSVQQELYPDEKCVEDQWPGESKGI